jgi:hypothetical protein
MKAQLAASLPSSVFPTGVVKETRARFVKGRHPRTGERCSGNRCMVTHTTWVNCDEALFDRNRQAWDCTTKASQVCGEINEAAPPSTDFNRCRGVPKNALWVYDEVTPGAPVRVRADEQGDPIWEIVQPTVDPAELAKALEEPEGFFDRFDVKTTAIWLGVGALAYLVLRRLT